MPEPATYQGTDCEGCDETFESVGAFEDHLEADGECPDAITTGDRVRLVIDTDDDPHLSHIDGRTGSVVRVPEFGDDAYYVAPDGEKGPSTVLAAGHELEVLDDE